MTFDVFVKTLTQKAKEMGIDPWEIYFANSEAVRITAYKGQAEDFQCSETQGLSLRAFIGGRMGYAYTEVLDEDSVALLLQGVKDSAALIEDTDVSPLQEPMTAKSLVFQTEDTSPAEMLSFALQTEKEALAAHPDVLQVKSCRTVKTKGVVHIVNSKGLNASFTQPFMYGMCMPVLKDGGHQRNGLAFRTLVNLRNYTPAELAKEGVDNALGKIGASPVPTGRYAVFFSPMAMSDLLEYFSSLFSAEAVQKGLSLLKGKLGKAIAAPCVTLLDDPFIPDAPGSRPFDDEGVPTQVVTLIDQGTLQTYYHNLKTAEKDGVQSNGHGIKPSVRGKVDIAPHNLMIRKGTLSEKELLKTRKEALYIDELQGLHAGANAISGDFSLSAQGFLLKDGQRVQNVEQITLSGNFLSLLQHIAAVADNLTFTLPTSAFSPTVLVEGLSVSGG